MSRNGSGIFSLPGGSAIANGDTSDATDINTPLNDIAADLNIARPIVAGGTGATSATAARTGLGVVIGTNVQAYNANLSSLAGLTLEADKGLYGTAADTVAMFDLTAAGRALIDDADAAAQRTTLGVVISTNNDLSVAPTELPTRAVVEANIRKRFTSAAQTIVTSELRTIAHGLGVVPGSVSYRLECLTAEAGYSIGDVIAAPSNQTSASTSRWNTATLDATNVYVRYCTASNCFLAGAKTDGGATTLTNASWQLFVEAYE